MAIHFGQRPDPDWRPIKHHCEIVPVVPPVVREVTACAAGPFGGRGLIGLCALDDEVGTHHDRVPSDCPLRRGPVVVRLAAGALIAEPMQAPQTI